MKARFTNAVCLAVLDKLLEAGELAAPFLDPVDQMLFPEYARLVAFPMDLGTIRSRLHRDPSYAGDRFASDVRLCFGNALFFNAPNDAVYTAAATLLALFEREWRKFADEPPELPPSAASSGASAVLVKRTALSSSNEPGKLLLTLRGGKKRPAVEDAAAAVAQKEKFGAHRARAEALAAFADQLMAGASLKKASATWIPRWSVVPTEMIGPSLDEAVEADVRAMLSVLEDTQSSGRVSKWLKTCLSQLDDKSTSDFLLYRLMAILGSEKTPFVEVFVLMQAPELVEKTRLWNVMFSALAQCGRHGRMVDVLQKLVFGPAAQFHAILAVFKAHSGHEGVMQALDQFGKWLLVDLKPSRTDLLAVTCAGFPKLRQSIGQLAQDAIAQTQDVESYSDLIRLSYGSDVSASLVKNLLLAGMADKAGIVASLLMQSEMSLARVLLLLDECSHGSKNSDDFEPIVRKLMKAFVQLAPVSQCRSLIKPFLAATESTRQQRFANVVASAFLSDPSRTSLESILSAVVLVASVPNSVSTFLMNPIVSSIERMLKQPGVAVQAVLQAMFSLESTHETGWKSWALERNRLLQMLVNWSPETKTSYERILQFRKVSLVCARMDVKKY